VEHVERFVSTVDSALRQRDDQHQLLSRATARIESYDAVEAPNDECVKVNRSWPILASIPLLSYVDNLYANFSV